MDSGLDRTVFDLHLIHGKRSPFPNGVPGKPACWGANRGEG